jgi:uncharacterized membrane protein
MPGFKLRDDRKAKTPEEAAEAEDAGAVAEQAVLIEQIARLERSLEAMRRQTERLVNLSLRVIKITLPLAILGSVLLLVYVFYPQQFGATLTRMGSGVFLGKLSAIGGQENFVFWVLVLGTVDVVVGLFLVWNFDMLYRVPWIGPRFRTVESRGSDLLHDHSWVRRLAFVGIVLVVIVPFQGTGAVMGSILGRLIGIGPWRTFLAIAIGAYTGVALVLSGSAAVTGLTRLHPATGVGALVVLIGGAWLAWRKWFRESEVVDTADAVNAAQASPVKER